MAPRPLELLAPLDVVLLVKAGLDLQQRRHLLARLRRVCKRAHDGRIAADAIERLLDGHDLWVARGLLHEADDRVKAVVGMVQEDVPRPQGVKDAPLIRLQVVRDVRAEGLVLEMLKARQAIDLLHQEVQIERAVDAVDLVAAGLQRMAQKANQRIVRILGDLQADDGPPLALFEGFLDGKQQICRVLLVEAEVAVSRDAVRMAAQDAPAVEKPANGVRDDLLEQDERMLRLAAQTGQLDDARQRGGHLHGGEVGRVAVLVARGQQHAQVEALVEDQREGTRTVDRHRREHRIDLVLEIAPDPLAQLGRELLVLEEAHAVAQQIGQHVLAQDLILLGHHQLRALRDQRNLPLGRESGRVGLFIAGVALIAQRRDADHEKLVEVGRDDREKLHPFKDGIVRIGRLHEHALVEFQPAELPVQVQVAVGQSVGFTAVHVGTPHLIECSHYTIETRLFRTFFFFLHGGRMCARALRPLENMI